MLLTSEHQVGEWTLTGSIDLALWKRKQTRKEYKGAFVWLRLWPG